MTVKYYIIPFGSSGDRSSVPTTTPIDGSVSYTDGFGPDYSLPLSTDPDALTISRNQFNQVMYDVTNNIQQYQQHAVPEFITTSDNGGSPFSYSKNAMVRWNNGSTTDNYISLADTNTALPSDNTKWFLMNGNAMSAAYAAAATIVNDTTTNASMFPVWVTTTSGNLPLKVSSTKISFNPSTGILSASGFNGPLTGAVTGNVTGNLTGDSSGTHTGAVVGNVTGNLTGNVTGNTSGSSGSCTGNSATATLAAAATALATPRNINGVAFDGTANITVPAAGSTLTDTTTVAKGGTGQVTLAAHGVVIGNGTSGVSVTGAGTAGQALISNGASADPTFQTLSTGAGLGANTFTGAQIGTETTLTSTSGSIAITLSDNNNFKHAMTENTTLANPGTITAGQSGYITFTQNGSAAKTLAFGSAWKEMTTGVAPSISTTLSAKNVLFYQTIDSSTIFYSFQKAGVS